jgi:hypothetical protein
MVKVHILIRLGEEKIKLVIIIGMKLLIIKIQAIILTMGIGIYEYYKNQK